MHAEPHQAAELRSARALAERGLHHLLFESARSAILVVDAGTHLVVAANAAARSMLQANMRTLQQCALPDLLPHVPPQRISRLLGGIARRRSGEFSFKAYLDAANQRIFDVCIRYGAMEPTSFVFYLSDISDQMAMIDQLEATETRLVTAIEALSDGFVLYDADDRLVLCNQRYRDFYPESAAAIVPGAKFEDILRFGLQNRQYLDAIGREDDWLRQRLTDHARPETVVEQQLENGRWLRIVERLTPQGGRVGLRVDITELKRQNERLQRAMRTDELTGLANRNGLRQALPGLAENLSDGERLAIFHIDLDRFKLINDVHGFEAGDHVLRKCASLFLHQEPRPLLVARIGGDEFVMIRRCEGSPAALRKQGNALISQLSRPMKFGNKICKFGASVGIACFDPSEGHSLQEALTNADIAVNAAKTIGRDEPVIFQSEMRDRATRANEMAREIQQGLSREELRPFFQPQVDTETGRVVGFESLIRWQHPTKGLVPAMDFLPVAQRSGLTDAIDDLVMDKSCEAARKLIDWGLSDACVSINVSIAQISDPRIVKRLRGHMTRHRVSPRNLRIELLESTLLDDRSAQIIENVHALIAEGLAIELDDFGTGHAAISTLRLFEVSRIKVDRSLVSHIDSDDELQLITSAVIKLAQSLGIDALAEGVETATEQDMLKSLGCHRAQGYLHARPMPIEDIRAWLLQRGEIAAADG